MRRLNLRLDPFLMTLMTLSCAEPTQPAPLPRGAVAAVTCSKDSDCPAGRCCYQNTSGTSTWCDACKTDKAAAADCASDKDCSDGKHCIGGRCVTTCLAKSKEPKKDPKKARDIGVVTPDCTANSGCPAGYSCQGGHCALVVQGKPA